MMREKKLKCACCFPEEYKDRNERIFLMHEEGANFKEIAREFGITYSRVRQIVKKVSRRKSAESKVIDPLSLRDGVSSRSWSGLVGYGISTKDELEDFLSRGGDLKSLCNIGRASEKEILKWLNNANQYIITRDAGDIKSQILSEIEESLGSHAVMVVADAMEKCPTLKDIIDDRERGVIPLQVNYTPSYGELDEDAFKKAQEEFIRRVDESLNSDIGEHSTFTSRNTGGFIPKGAPVVIRESTTEQLTPVQKFTRDWIKRHAKGGKDE